MKRSLQLLGVLGLVLLASVSFAQQDPLNTLYIQNPATVNPAYSGSREALSAVLSHREQWSGVNGAPATTNFNIHSPIKDKSLSLGFGVVNDEIGPVKQTGVYADVVYRLQVSRDGYLRFGLRGGGNIFNANFSELQTTEGQTGGTTDPSLNANISGEFLPAVGAGVYYSSQKFYGGVSVPTFLTSSVVPDGASQAVFSEALHVHVIAGGLVELSPSLLFKPSTALRFVTGSPVALDLTANFIVAEKFGLGVMHRLGDSFGGIAQFYLSEQFTVGYAYDYTTSDFSQNNGSHEILLSYDFVFRSSKIRSPRYF